MLGLTGQAKSVVDILSNGVHNEVWSMPKYVGSHALNVIDVFIAVDIPHSGTFPTLEEQGNGAFGPPNLAANAARDDGICPIK
jgi:hypothetical protein